MTLKTSESAMRLFVALRDDTKNACLADYAGVCLSVFIVVFSLAATKTPLIDFPATSDMKVL